MPAGVLKVGAGVVGFYVAESKLNDTANNAVQDTHTLNEGSANTPKLYF